MVSTAASIGASITPAILADSTAAFMVAAFMAAAFMAAAFMEAGTAEGNGASLGLAGQRQAPRLT